MQAMNVGLFAQPPQKQRKSQVLTAFDLSIYLRSNRVDARGRYLGNTNYEELTRNAEEWGKQYLSRYMSDETAEAEGAACVEQAIAKVQRMLEKKYMLDHGYSFYGILSTSIRRLIIDKQRRFEIHEQYNQQQDEIDDSVVEHDRNVIIDYLEAFAPQYKDLFIAYFSKDSQAFRKLASQTSMKHRVIIRQLMNIRLRMQYYIANGNAYRYDIDTTGYYHILLTKKDDRMLFHPVYYHAGCPGVYIGPDGSACKGPHDFRSVDMAVIAIQKHHRL